MSDLNSLLISEGVNDAGKREALVAAIRAASDNTHNIGPVNAAGDRILTMKAAAANRPALYQHLEQIKARAARLNFHFDDSKPIDTVEMDRCLRGGDITERLALKADLARYHLIP
jgi:hypothetical protein